jgi:spoIIIJ-associated protein
VSEELSVEATGETVGEAKWAALRELERRFPGLDKGFVRFQVVSEGERGLLGVGYEPARVLAVAPPSAASAVREAPARRAPAEPRDESEEAALLRELVERTADELDAECDVEIVEGEEELRAIAAGGDLGPLIGRHGQTIDALQFLANAIVYRGRDDRKRVVVDAAGYRDRRSSALEGVAARAAEQASATGQRVALEPMSSVERRLVHEALKDDPEVETESEGAEPYRYVVVVPRRSV